MYQEIVGYTAETMIEDWMNDSDSQHKLNLPRLELKPCLWVEKSRDLPNDKPGAYELIDVQDLRGYYCLEHGYIAAGIDCPEDDCGYVHPDLQLNLEEDFYSTELRDVEWNTIEGLNTRAKKDKWRKIIMRGADMDHQWLVKEMIAARIKSLKWQIVNNQWFFLVGDRIFWRTPSWDEINAKGRYYDELLHLIRHPGKVESEYKALSDRSSYDI